MIKQFVQKVQPGKWTDFANTHGLGMPDSQLHVLAETSKEIRFIVSLAEFSSKCILTSRKENPDWKCLLFAKNLLMRI